MTEKIISTISKIYAKSLIDVAMESNSLDKFHQQLGEVLSVLKSSCDLQKVIGNPTIKLEHKLNCEITPSWSVDESIIAGLLFKFDDYVIDTSVRTKIESLSKSISR